jgi:hypothetical protein
MRVLAVTSVGGACGIANYAEMAMDAVRAADPTIQTQCSAEALDPRWVWTTTFAPFPDVIWLNYHRGLHSRWTLDEVAQLQQAGRKVVITFHDTYGESAPDALTQALHDLADAFIVHEPCVGLDKQILIRQGVPPYHGYMEYDYRLTNWRPVLGTAGFNFPWKNFDRLAEVTAEAGWAYVVYSNNATEADRERWTSANPYTQVFTGFLPTSVIVAGLAGCDATAFPYECANSGTSGAIRLGIAARKPVLAFSGCRQMRDLVLPAAGGPGAMPDPRIIRCANFTHLHEYLQVLHIQRVDAGIVALATRDSWVNQGKKYAEVFRRVLA